MCASVGVAGSDNLSGRRAEGVIVTGPSIARNPGSTLVAGMIT